MNRTNALPLQRPAEDDTVLPARARSGDAHARDALIARYLDEVFALTARMLGDPDLGADAAQDAFVNALRALGSFRGESSFRTWLLRIAANSARSMMRRNGRRRETPLNDVEAYMAAPALDPASSAVQKTEAERALTLLARLPPKQRQVVTLRVTRRSSSGFWTASSACVQTSTRHGRTTSARLRRS